MQHLGDVPRINGGEIPPVDVITFGSPCQDLSVAGKRKGMQHSSMGDAETTRSGLFMEAVRIIEEMRRATDGVYPRVAVWENVVGAFSSQGGKDFCAVLNTLISVADPSAPVLRVPARGWPTVGRILGRGYSLAWRVFDAQFGEFPKDAAESSLSQILEANAPKKYYLSAMACAGILRRIERRGKALPEVLMKTLKQKSEKKE